MRAIETNCPYCNMHATYVILAETNAYKCHCGKTVWVVLINDGNATIITDERMLELCVLSGQPYPDDMSTTWTLH